MITFHNQPVREAIGLDEMIFSTFEEQLRAKGFTSKGCINLLSPEQQAEGFSGISSFSDVVEIYSTRKGYHLYVSPSAKFFYTTDSSD